LPTKRLSLNERQKKALDYLKSHGAITNKQYRTINNITKINAYRDIDDLLKKAIIRQVGSGVQTSYILIGKV